MAMTGKRLEPQVFEEFVKLFEEHLEKNKLTLMEVADKVEMSQSYLSRILSRERGLPSDEKVLQMAKALKINPPESLLIVAGRIPATKGETDSAKIDKCIDKINQLAQESKEIKEAAESNAFIAKVLLGIAALAGVILVAITAFTLSRKKGVKNDA